MSFGAGEANLGAMLMRKAVHFVLGLAMAVSASSAAQAQVMLDLSEVTCDQWVKYQVANPKFIAMWLSGYFHGKRGDTMIDTQKLIADADAVENYCFKNPQAPLMPAVETIVGTGK
jgi:acid stress chaperone HdeB